MPTFPSYAAKESIPSGPFATTAVGRSTATPVIAGTVTGGVIGIAWIVMLIMWFVKRRKRLNKAKKAGLKTHRLLPDKLPKPEPYIIPPDPAIVEGVRVPGEKVYPEKANAKHGDPRRAKTMPLTRNEKETEKGESPSETPAMSHHPASAPSRVLATADPSAAYTHPTPGKLPLSPGDLERGDRAPFDQ